MRDGPQLVQFFGVKLEFQDGQDMPALRTLEGRGELGNVNLLPNFDELIKSQQNDDFVKNSPAKAGQGPQKLRSEVPEGTQTPQGPHEAQRHRWTFYETINFDCDNGLAGF